MTNNKRASLTLMTRKSSLRTSKAECFQIHNPNSIVPPITSSRRAFLNYGRIQSNQINSIQKPLFVKNQRIQISSFSPTFFYSNNIISLRSNLGSIAYFSSWNPNNNKPPRISNNSRVGLLSGLIGSAFFLGGKTKYLIGALKLTKFASLGSMLFTVGTYSIFFGLPYAVGMVSLILIHESGHALVMKHYNIPFSPMVFVPFVGATVAMNKTPRDAYQEAMIALGGPALGSLGAFGVAGAAQLVDSQLMYALADFGFMINLFNLLPIGMMDGGRICGALSPYSGVVGLGMGGALIYMDMITNPIFYLVMMGGAYTTFQRFYYPENLPYNYYKITPKERAILTSSYFGLIGFLVSCMAFNEKYKKSPEQLEMEKRFQQNPYQFQNYR